jgi:hypothetical protein
MLLALFSRGLQSFATTLLLCQAPIKISGCVWLAWGVNGLLDSFIKNITINFDLREKLEDVSKGGLYLLSRIKFILFHEVSIRLFDF